MKTISILTPCYNEEGNVLQVYERVRAVMARIGRYRYEHVFIDNRSQDNTFAILKHLSEADKNVKVIRNTRNFGHIRSPLHGFMQTRGDAVIGIVADLQDPPELIEELIAEWEKGFALVLAIKRESHENSLMYWLRTQYYKLVRRLSEIETFENFNGFGLYDRKVVDMIKQFRDPYPYFRGMIAEIGIPHAEIFYTQERRKSGKTKNNLFSLYDVGMLGITTLSKVPLRLVTFTGFLGSFISFLAGAAYFAYKILYWNQFSVGIAPLVIGFFFLGSLQMLFMGILGEYVGNIHTQVQDRPLVFESERINFEYDPAMPLRSAPVSETSECLS